MKHVAIRSMAAAALAFVLTAAIVVAQPLSGSLLEPDPILAPNALTLGSSAVDQRSTSKLSLETLGQKVDRSAVGLGVDVAPLRQKFGNNSAADRSAATQIYRLADTELLRTTAIGFDLTLRWPALSAHESSAIPLQPYVSVGPALLVARPDDSGWNNTGVFSRPTTLRSDTTSMSLGMKSALGLTWQLTKDASLFGEYRLIQDRLGLPGHGTSDRGGSDLFYGFSLRF